VADYFDRSYVTTVRGNVRGRGNPPSSRAFAFALDATLWSHRKGARQLGPHAFDFSVVKSLSSPSGQWSFSYDAASARLDPLDIEDDDWMGLAIREQFAKTNDLLMFGPVDGSRRGIKTDDRTGIMTPSGRLTGRDHGKPFEVHDVVFNEFLQLAEPVLPGLIDAAKFSALTDLIHANQLTTPGMALFQLLSTLVGSDDGWYYLPQAFGVKALSNLIAVESDVTDGQLVQLGTYTPEGAQKLDQYLRSLFLTPFTEFFYDLRPYSDTTHKIDLEPGAGAFFEQFGVIPTVVFRQIPFVELTSQGSGATMSDAWFNLDTHYVEPSEVLDEDLGRSGSERFTMFSVRAPPFAPSATLGAWGASGGRIPAFDFEKSALSPIKGRSLAVDVAKHGLRVLDVSDGLAPLTGSTGATGERAPALEWLAERTASLYQLYRAIPGMVDGTIKLAHLRPEIRPGTRLEYDGREYYVEQVEHGGRVDGGSGLLVGETSLTVVHGTPIGEQREITSPRAWKAGKLK